MEKKVFFHTLNARYTSPAFILCFNATMSFRNAHVIICQNTASKNQDDTDLVKKQRKESRKQKSHYKK